MPSFQIGIQNWMLKIVVTYVWGPKLKFIPSIMKLNHFWAISRFQDVNLPPMKTKCLWNSWSTIIPIRVVVHIFSKIWRLKKLTFRRKIGSKKLWKSEALTTLIPIHFKSCSNRTISKMRIGNFKYILHWGQMWCSKNLQNWAESNLSEDTNYLGLIFNFP